MTDLPDPFPNYFDVRSFVTLQYCSTHIVNKTDAELGCKAVSSLPHLLRQNAMSLFRLVSTNVDTNEKMRDQFTKTAQDNT